MHNGFIDWYVIRKEKKGRKGSKEKFNCLFRS